MGKTEPGSKALLESGLRQGDEGYAPIKAHLISFEKSERLEEVPEIQRQKTEDDSQGQENALSQSDEARNRLPHETMKAGQVGKNEERTPQGNPEDAYASYSK